MSGPPSKLERGLFWLAVVVLLAAHMVSCEQGDRPLVLGWLPIDMAYRVAWMACAAGLVAWMTTRLWPEPPAEPPTKLDGEGEA